MSGCLKQARLCESNQLSVSHLRLAAGRNEYTLPLSDILSAFHFLESTTPSLAREYRNDLIAARVQCIDLEYHQSWRAKAADDADKHRMLLQEADDRRIECYFTLRSKLGLSAHEFGMAQALKDLLEYERVSDIGRLTGRSVRSKRMA